MGPRPLAVAAGLALLLAATTIAAADLRYDRDVEAEAGAGPADAEAAVYCTSHQEGPQISPCFAVYGAQPGDDPGSDPGNASASVASDGTSDGTPCPERNCVGATVTDGAGASADATDDDGDGAADEASVRVIKQSRVQEAITDADGSSGGKCGLAAADGEVSATCGGGQGAGGDALPAGVDWQTGSADAGNYSASIADPGNASAGAGGSHGAGIEGATGDDYISGGMGSDYSVGASTTDDDGDGLADDAEVQERADANGRKTVQPRDV